MSALHSKAFIEIFFGVKCPPRCNSKSSAEVVGVIQSRFCYDKPPGPKSAGQARVLVGYSCIHRSMASFTPRPKRYLQSVGSLRREKQTCKQRLKLDGNQTGCLIWPDFDEFDWETSADPECLHCNLHLQIKFCSPNSIFFASDF